MNESGMNKSILDQSNYSELGNRPGYLIRRLHQIHVAMFLEECKEFNVTPVQFGVLTVLYNSGTSGLVSISRHIGVDRITVADVVRRLERRHLVARPENTADKRKKVACLTDEGRKFVELVQPAMIKAQHRFIEPLNDTERVQFSELMNKLILANDDSARAPIQLK